MLLTLVLDCPGTVKCGIWKRQHKRWIVSGKSDVEIADICVPKIEMLLTLVLDRPESERAVLISQSTGDRTTHISIDFHRKLNKGIRKSSLSENILFVKLEPNKYLVFFTSICLTSKQC
jgi:hypothetical protein